MNTELERKRLSKLLTERGVQGAEGIVDVLEDDALDGAFAAVARIDEKETATPGLYVYRLRHDDLAGYRPANQRERADLKLAPAGISDALRRSIRGSCNSPNGYTRDEARGMLADKAKWMRMPVDALIDAAMGREWQESPVHPALSRDGSCLERFARYAAWVGEAA